MTDHESDEIRTLFQSADLEHVPAARDLVGPAVAWGSGRRRRDRWTAAGVTCAVAAVAVAGVVALRPDGEGGSRAVAPGAVPTQSSAKATVPPTTAPTVPRLSGTIAQREQELLDSLKPYLPAGVRITCQDMGQQGVCPMMVFTGPTGTSIGQWAPGMYDYQSGPADTKYEHPHQPTAAIPLVSGTVKAAGATVQVISTDIEAQDNVGDTTALTDPKALTFHTAVYEFKPTDIAPAFSMELTELVREMPWKPGAGQGANDHAMWGFNPAGPVLSPQQFATLASAPIFPEVRQKLADLNLQAMQNSTSAPSSSSR